MMRTMILVVAMVGCGGEMSAKDACESLASQGIGSGCEKGEPGGLGAGAWEQYDLAITEPKGKRCQVLSHRDTASYDATVKAFEGAAALAGPHRYGNPKRRIFVQCNSGMPREAGAKLEAAVSAL